ncbi:peroxiredoxin family protein [Vulgatibacter sp.]|uniref:peroxiredoxin family protein n=1 Tax=Vulgatibacter sp. TaxID=1971226 RepID=UPI0035639772
MTLAPDAPFPSLFLPRVGGGTVHLGGPAPTLVLVFRVDCAASGHAAQAVGRIAEKLQPKGLVVVGVAQDDPGDAAAFAAEHGLGTVELCTDASSYMASDALEVGRTPTVLLVDRQRVVASLEGWARREYNGLAARAAELVGAEAPTASPRSDGLPDIAPATVARNAG